MFSSSVSAWLASTMIESNLTPSSPNVSAVSRSKSVVAWSDGKRHQRQGVRAMTERDGRTEMNSNRDSRRGGEVEDVPFSPAGRWCRPLLALLGEVSPTHADQPCPGSAS